MRALARFETLYTLQMLRTTPRMNSKTRTKVPPTVLDSLLLPNRAARSTSSKRRYGLIPQLGLTLFSICKRTKRRFISSTTP